ncbi:hypothetical protein IAT38_007945 [Cryptococcus sp. DSM 104549]
MPKQAAPKLKRAAEPFRNKGKEVARPSKRPRYDGASSDGESSGSGGSSSGSESEDDEDGEEDEEEQKRQMLAALEARSRALLGLEPVASGSGSGSGAKRSAGVEGSSDESGDDSEDSGVALLEDEDDSDDFHTDDGWGAEDGFVTDSEDEFAQVVANTKASSKKREEAAGESASKVPEVVFDGSATAKSSAPLSKAERRAFLTGNSAKMMGITTQPDYLPGRPRNPTSTDADELANVSLDKTLHNMLLKDLLSPAAQAENALRPVEKRNAIHARLLELANLELPGQGSEKVKGQGLSKQPVSVRTGLVHAKAKRAKAQREEAIAAGNYVKGKGGLGDVRQRWEKGEQRAGLGVETGKKKGMDSAKKGDGARGRGLGMGVGRFEGGALKFSAREVEQMSGAGGSSGGGWKGKGSKKGGKGKGKRR